MSSSARVRCPICAQSTSAPDGHCEFCGNAIAGRTGESGQVARAQRLSAAEPAAAGAPASPEASASSYDDEERAADRDAEIAFLTGMLGFFGGNILQFFVGPFAGIVGIVLLGVAIQKGLAARRALAALGRKNWMAGCGLWLGIVGMALTLVAIALLATLLAVFAARG